MHYTTIEEIEICREIIKANEDRLQAISRRATAISQEDRNMTPAQLANASEEIADLRKEVIALKNAMRKAKLAIKSFYAPATTM